VLLLSGVAIIDEVQKVQRGLPREAKKSRHIAQYVT